MTEHTSEHAEQIRRAFVSHEYLAPDAAAVLARADVLARTYQRRRRGAQAAGGAVLGAGLVTGAVALPSILPNGAGQKVVIQGAAAAPPAAKPTPMPTPSTKEQLAERDKNWEAYFGAGYGYEDSLKLAKIWNMPDEPGAVKAEAGRRLLAGELLPIQPGPEAPYVEEPGSEITEKEQAALDAFFDAGYDYDDAEKLAALWKTDDIFQVKADAGQKILDGETLPVAP